MTSVRAPAFYLSSTEAKGDLAQARACRHLQQVNGPDAREYLRVTVTPPVIGQPFGLGGRDIDDVILSPRHLGGVLSPLSEDPLAVQVYLIRNSSILATGRFAAEDVELIAWGEVYSRESDAQNACDG